MRAEAPRTAGFDEDWYARHNPDIASAIAAGAVASGYAHWLHSGRAENRVPPPGFGGEEEFGEAAYLLANPDVAAAVAAGDYPSGQAHYDQLGRAEGRVLRRGERSATSASTAAASALFDEAWYLDQNHDVRRAIAAGVYPSAYQHWVSSGRQEGRAAPPGFDENALFDEAFYLLSYPEVPREIAEGRAVDAQHHFMTVGQFRGYLPNGFAPRPPVRPGLAGFWTDADDALDQVEGRIATGQVSAECGDLLNHWVRYGYVILPHALPDALVDPAAASLRAAFAGTLSGARFDCPAISPYGAVPWSPAVQDQPARAVDLHWMLPDIRDLLFAPPIRRFLELVFGRVTLVSRSYGTLRGVPQDYGRDVSTVPFSMPLRSAACCIALDQAEAGIISYYPGSHKLPALLLGGTQYSLDEARRVLPRKGLLDAQDGRDGALLQQLRDASLPAHEFWARKGDVMLWNPALVYAVPEAGPRSGSGSGPSRSGTPSVTAHFCPRGIVPLGFEGVGSALRWHNRAGQYSSTIYGE